MRIRHFVPFKCLAGGKVADVLGGKNMTENVEKFLDENQKIKVWPKRKDDKNLVVEYLASKFENDRIYSEKEINEVIQFWHTFNDHTLLRRELVEQKFLCRTPDCKEYRLRVTSKN